MSKKKFNDMMLATSTLKPAAERHETPDLTAPPSTGMGLTTQRIQLQQKVSELQKRIDELEVKGAARAQRVPLSLVDPNPWQPRCTFDVTLLADSIKAVGVLQPIIARKHPQQADRYQLVAGERRLRASQVAEASDIPVIVVDLDDASMALLSLTENFAREDLTDFEVGMGLVRIQAEFPNKTALAESIGMNRTVLYRFLAFGNLPDYMINDLRTNPALVGASFAEELASLIKKNAKASAFVTQLPELWALVVQGKLSQSVLLARLHTALNPPAVSSAMQIDDKQLFFGGKKVGSIKKDQANFTLKLKSANLSVDQEQQIRALIAKFFK